MEYLSKERYDEILSELNRLMNVEYPKVKEDLDVLAADAFADACRPGNPKDTNVDDLKALYRKIMA